MQNQIEAFTASAQSFATEYMDPAIILQHVPVLNEHLDKIQLLIDHKEMVLVGLIALIFARRILKKRKKAAIPTAMAAPSPDQGKAAPAPEEKVEAKARTSSLDALAKMVSPRSKANSAPAAAAKRSTEDQLADVSAVSFAMRPALTPDEARLRVIVEAAVKSLGAPLMVMARTSLQAIIEPGVEAVGHERAHALAATEGKSLDFGLFDRAGRLVLALELPQTNAPSPSVQSNRAIVAACLAQAGIPRVTMQTTDTPAELAGRIAPYIGARAPQAAPLAKVRPVRPTRPSRPTRPAVAIAAE